MAVPLGTAMGSVLDPKWMGRPKTYDGDKKNWRKFATSVKGYVGAICPELLAMMKIAQTLRDPVPNHYLNQVQRQYDAALYYILTNLTEGDATDLMDGVDEARGWRRGGSCKMGPDTLHRNTFGSRFARGHAHLATFMTRSNKCHH